MFIYRKAADEFRRHFIRFSRFTHFPALPRPKGIDLSIGIAAAVLWLMLENH